MTKATFGVSVGVVLCAVGFVVWRSVQLPKVKVVPGVTQDVTSTLAVSGVLESANRSAEAMKFLVRVRVAGEKDKFATSISQG